mgnify:CR=1 FL=1
MWVKNRKNILIDVKGSREVNQIKRSFLSIFWGIPTYITGGNKDVWILRKTASHGIVINRDGSEMWWLYVSSWWYFLSSLMKGFLNHNFPGLETNYQGNKQLQHNYITKFPGNIVFGLLIRWSHMYPFTSLSVSLSLSLSLSLKFMQIYICRYIWYYVTVIYALTCLMIHTLILKWYQGVGIYYLCRSQDLR